MSLLTATGKFGCFTAAHYINSLDELSYLIEHQLIDNSHAPKYLCDFYTCRSSNNPAVFTPNAIYLERETRVRPPSAYTRWREESASGRSTPPPFRLNDEIEGVTDMLDDQSSLMIPRLAKNRPATEHRDTTDEAIRHLLESMDRLVSVTLPLDTATLSNAHLNIIDQENLIPSPLQFFEEDSTKTPIFVLAGAGFDAKTIPETELHANQLILQSALTTYLDIHQCAKNSANIILCPVYQSPLVAYPSKIASPTVESAGTSPASSAASTITTRRGQLDLDTVYDKCLVASTLIHASSLASPAIWANLRTPFSPLVSATVGVSLSSWEDKSRPVQRHYEADLTRLHPSDYIDAEYLSRFHQFHTKCDNAKPVALSWSTDLKVSQLSNLSFGYTLAAAVNAEPVLQPCPAGGAISTYLQDFLPEVLRRSDVVDRIDRDHVIELKNVLLDIQDDLRTNRSGDDLQD